MNADDSTCEIHVLTSAGDWLNMVWTLKSFYAVGPRYRLCIHEDGSLHDAVVSILHEHFPRARIIRRADADARLSAELRAFPASTEFRTANPLALKVFDFASFLQSERMLLLDSDILFFGEPTELLDRIVNPGYRLNTLNRDWSFGYTVEPEAIAPALDFALQPLVNSGLGLIQRESIDLPSIERWLRLPGVVGHPHRIEQTLIAMYSCRFGFEFLPAEYDVDTRISSTVGPCRHYTGPIRHLMYREGIRRLSKGGFLSRVATPETVGVSPHMS